MKPCTGCGGETADHITVRGLRLPYHQECADAAWRDLRAIRDGITDALAERRRARCGAVSWGQTFPPDSPPESRVLFAIDAMRRRGRPHRRGG
jgi:hypothetical protein